MDNPAESGPLQSRQPGRGAADDRLRENASAVK